MVYEPYILVQRHQSDSLIELRTDLLTEVGARGAIASKNTMHRIDRAASLDKLIYEAMRYEIILLCHFWGK